MIGQNSVAAATAVVGYDLADGTNWQAVGFDRMLNGAALKGSAAAGDSKVDIFIDQEKVAELFNTGVGFPNMDDMYPLEVPVPAFSKIRILVTDAPTTNPLNVACSFEE